MRSLLLLTLLASLFLGCNPEDDTQAPGDSPDVFIRIENASNFTYEEILVKIDEDHEYGNLGAGELSGYQPYEWAYRYAYVELKVEELRLALQPIDYVGETMLAAGYYSYIISLNESSTGLKLELRED